MSKRTRILAALMATMTITTALAGCGTKKEEGKSGETTKLTVWSHLKTNEIDNVIRPIAEEWGKENNVEVTVIEDKAEMQDAITACKSSKGPDVYFGTPNDNLGTMKEAGVLAEVKSGVINKSDYTADNVIEAVTIDGKQWALPIAQETTCLFYNKSKVTEVPKTMEEVVEMGKTKGFQYEAHNLYLSYGFIAANGGYIFKNNGGTLDSNDIGLGNDGAKKGYTLIKSMIDAKLFNADITDDVAKANFTNGTNAFYISGPWSLADCEKSGIDFGIATLPSVGSGQTKPFMGVQTAFVNANSKNQDKSWELLKYLSEKTPAKLITEGSRLPVLKSAQSSDEFKANKYFATLAKQAEVATPMPNIKQVQTIWTPGKNNLVALLSGTQGVDDTASKIESQVKEGIAQQ